MIGGNIIDSNTVKELMLIIDSLALQNNEGTPIIINQLPDSGTNFPALVVTIFVAAVGAWFTLRQVRLTIVSQARVKWLEVFSKIYSDFETEVSKAIQILRDTLDSLNFDENGRPIEKGSDIEVLTNNIKELTLIFNQVNGKSTLLELMMIQNLDPESGALKRLRQIFETPPGGKDMDGKKGLESAIDRIENEMSQLREDIGVTLRSEWSKVRRSKLN